MSGKQRPQVLAADAAGISRAAELLRAGKLVAIPTETVYGLAARADREAAVARIYRAKGRPQFNPLIVHVADAAAAERLAMFDDRARELAARFWPGPLTMVLPLRPESGLAPAVTAGLLTVALRVPSHPIAQAVLAETRLPLAAPSANRSGGVSPTSGSHVAASLGETIDAVLEGGPCEKGLESTIVALRETGAWHLLRAGPVGEEDLASLLGPASSVQHTRIEAPGQLARHYSPGKPVRLGALEASEEEFMIGFGAVNGDCNLSQRGDLFEAAARLYACLHLAAQDNRARIAVAPVADESIGRAINDRLRRAST